MRGVKGIIDKQRKYFLSNKTVLLKFRKAQLKALYASIKSHEEDVLLALKQDLNKTDFEAYETELGIVYEEIRFMIRNIDRLMKPKCKKTPIIHFPTRSYEYQDPYGCVLIIAPWNYPFQLAMAPLIGAIAAGNCVVVKPSEEARATSKVIKHILEQFEEEYICVVEGDREVSNQLLDEKFDLIFFTGSPRVGRLVMEKASKNLTPVILELGGKSPCIVDNTANIDLAAKRIIWGKLLNAGQTCVAPDYVLVHKDVKEALIYAFKKYIKQFYGEKPEENVEYPKIINQSHFERLIKLIHSSEKYIGGKFNMDTMQIAPAIIDECSWESEVMEEEIFGPILPVIVFEEISDIIHKINSRPKPLAAYLFTTASGTEEKVLNTLYFGGGCINDTIIHLANPNISFGGVGNSGMGRYHGKESFYAFSHAKSISKKSNLLDIGIRYAPYDKKIKILEKIM